MTRSRRSFPLVLGLTFGRRLPLHVARVVGTAVLERLHVVDNVAGARARALPGRWTRVRALEISLRACRPLDVPVAVALGARRLGRAVDRARHVLLLRRGAGFTAHERPNVRAVLAIVALDRDGLL